MECLAVSAYLQQVMESDYGVKLRPTRTSLSISLYEGA